MRRALWIVGLLLIWWSVVVITYGTHLQTQSPRFQEFRLATIREEAGSDSEQLNPAGRMALELSFNWPFACGSSGFIALLFSAMGFGIWIVDRWNREFALVLSGAFGLGCLVGAAMGAEEALKSFNWGFGTLGIGFLLSATGLCIGGLGMVLTLLAGKSSAKSSA